MAARLKEREVDVVVETDRLLFRRFTEADADDMYELDNDPEVMRFLNGGTPTPRAVILERMLPRFVASTERFDGFGFWAAIEKSGDEFLGWFSFRPEDEEDPGDVELGYRLRRESWGKGYGTEGARALIRKGFAELGVRRVVATTYEANVGSRRVMEKLGMTLVRTFRPTLSDIVGEGTFHVEAPVLFDGNDVEYALTKDDWERREAADPRPTF